MKKTLALVLALVMIMGMMVVPASAAFDDAADIQYKEAVDVMAAIGVIEGYNNEFNPKGELTRAAGAKLVAYLELGAKGAEALTAEKAPFADVPADHWAAGYIGWAASKGYINGLGDGNFAPDAPLTALAYAKLMLCALGYDAAVEGFTGNGWEYNVLALALDKDIDLFDGNDDADFAKVATREEAALYSFNALNAEMVKYDSKGTKVEINGAIISTGASSAEGTDELLREARYADLKLYDEADVTDKYGRPSVKWEYDDEEVGFYSESPLAVYAGAKFDDETLEDDFEDYDVAYNIVYNGGIDPSVDQTALEASRKGYTIEVYGDKDTKDIDLFVVYEAVAAELTEINTNDDDEVVSVDITVLAPAGEYTITVDAEDDEDAYEMVKDYAEEDIFAIVVKAGTKEAAESARAARIFDVADVEAVEGEITNTKLTSGYNGTIKVDGTTYTMAWSYSQAALQVEDEGVVYLYDGYVLHSDMSGAANEDYAYLLEIGEDVGVWGTDYFAKVVKLDGSVETLEIAKASYDQFTGGLAVAKTQANFPVLVDYNEDDEVYTLEVVYAYVGAPTIEKGKTAVGTASANSKTVYVLIDLKDTWAVDTVDVFTGYKAVKSVETVATWAICDGAAEYVFALVNKAVDADADELIYVAGDSISAQYTDKDLGTYYTYKAIVDGEIVEIMAKDSGKNGLFASASINDDGIYTALNAADSADYTVVDTDGSDEGSTIDFGKASNEVIKIDGASFAYAEDVVVYVVDADGAITTGSINRNYSDVESITYTDNDDGEVTALYIVKK